MSKLLIICLLYMTSTQVFSESVTGTITKLQAVSDTFSRPAIGGYIFFQLSAPLVAGCSWLSLGPNNNYFTSTLLSAQARNKSVSIIYDELNHVEESICSAQVIEVAE